MFRTSPTWRGVPAKGTCAQMMYCNELDLACMRANCAAQVTVAAQPTGCFESVWKPCNTCVGAYTRQYACSHSSSFCNCGVFQVQFVLSNLLPTLDMLTMEKAKHDSWWLQTNKRDLGLVPQPDGMDGLPVGFGKATSVRTMLIAVDHNAMPEVHTCEHWRTWLRAHLSWIA